MTTLNDTPTPMCDAQAFRRDYDSMEPCEGSRGFWVPIDFARTLELESARRLALLKRAQIELSLFRATAFEAENDVRCARLTILVNDIDAEGRE